MSKSPLIPDRDARRAQALRSNLRRRKAAPEPALAQDAPAPDEEPAPVQASPDTISQP